MEKIELIENKLISIGNGTENQELPSLPFEVDLDLGKLSIIKLKKAIEKIKSTYKDFDGTNEEKETLAKTLESFEKIFNFVARPKKEKILQEDLALWEEYESEKGEAFEILEGKQDDTLKTAVELAMAKTSLIAEAEKKEESKEEVKVIPEKKEFSSEVKAKIDKLKINEETFRAIPGFETIADSEGKILSVLNNLDTVRLKRIESDARADHEKYVREAESLWGKMGRSFFKTGKIAARKDGYGKQEFDFNKHREDIEGLIHLASVGPEISVTKDEKTGEVKLTSEYIGNFEGLDSVKRTEFNEVATAYSNLPQEYAWKKLPKETQEEYKKIKSEYEKKKGEVLSTLPEKEGMRIMNDVDFNVKMNQTLHAYPDAELQLKKLAESGRFGSTWESIKAQMVDGGGALFGGAVIRGGSKVLGVKISGSLATKSTIISLTGPLGATILAGAGIGWWRGGVRGRKKLDEEEELLRLGFEDQTTENKKVAQLAKEIETTKQLIASADKDGISEKSKKYTQKKLERLEAEIIEARKKGTDKNLQGADELGNKLSIKIDQLKNFLQMEYKDYVNTPEGKNASPEQFQEKREQWAEKLEVRLEYTKKKLDDGKIIFGKEKDALKNRYDLIQKMAEASAEVALIPHYDEKEFARTYGNKTRRGQLEKVLLSAEERIAQNRDTYLTHQKIKGALSGGLLSGAGFSLTHLAMEHFGSSVAHTIHEQAGELPHLKGKEIDLATMATMKAYLGHEYAYNLIEHKEFSLNIEHPSTVPESKPFEYVVQNNTQSRESTLIKFYESKGLSHHEAGTKANLEIHKMFHGKDEIHNIHKGDHIVITEQDGKPHFEVQSQHKEVRLAKPEIKSAPDTHPVVTHLQKNPEKFGFKGDVHDHASVKVWADKHLAQLAAEDKKFLQANPEHIKEVYPTVTGKIGVTYEAPHEALSSLISHYEVKSPTNIVNISENILSKDPRWTSLNNDAKDRVLYQFVVKQIIGSGHEDLYYQSLGIASGNPFDIKPGTLNLNNIAGKGALDKAFASAHDSSLGIARGFRNKIGGIIRETTQVGRKNDPEDYMESVINQLLIRK